MNPHIHLGDTEYSYRQKKKKGSPCSQPYKSWYNTRGSFGDDSPVGQPIDCDTDPHDGQSKRRIEQKKYEVLMIISSHAVANPRTMMVHPLNAGVALFTVMYPWQFDNIAFLAKSRFLQLSDFFMAKSTNRYS